jgi:hypothetical protein
LYALYYQRRLLAALQTNRLGQKSPLIKVSYLISYSNNVSLSSGLPMVRQGLRSLQNERAGLPHYLPPSPKSREAEKPKGRKPGKPGGRKGRNADWAEGRPIRRNLVCVYLILPVCHDAIRHATTQRPRGDKNILCSLLIIFQSKLRVCLTHPPSHSNDHILKRETVLMPIPLEPGYVKFRTQSRTISRLTCGRPESRLQPTSGN